jgi:hypothetical protein
MTGIPVLPPALSSAIFGAKRLACSARLRGADQLPLPMSSTELDDLGYEVRRPERSSRPGRGLVRVREFDTLKNELTERCVQN